VLIKLWPTLAIVSESVKMVEIGERMHTRQATNVSEVEYKAYRRTKEPRGRGGAGHLCLVRLSARVDFSKVTEPGS
jgi:hypothetical protein